MRTFHVDICTVPQEDLGEVGLVEVKRPIERRLGIDATDRADWGVQLATAVDQAPQHLFEIFRVVVDADGDVKRSQSTRGVSDTVEHLDVGKTA